MALRPDIWKQLYRVFDPTARLELWNQELYVERPDSAMQSIVSDIDAGLEPTGKWVVCGSAGSGKSSALVHLAASLQRRRSVIALDLPRSVSRIDQIRPAEVLFLMGAGAVRVLHEELSVAIAPPLVDELILGFRGLLAPDARSLNIGDIIKGVALFAANVAAPGIGAVANAATGAAQITAGVVGNAQVRRAQRPGQLGGLTRHVNDGEPDLNRLSDAVDAIFELFPRDRQPIVLVDGLDKMQRIEAIRELFAVSRILTEPHVPVVYAGPITLMLSTEWQAAGGVFKRIRLANIAVEKPEIERVHVTEEMIARGREVLRAIVTKRLATQDCREVDAFTPGELDRLINASGGLLRDLVHLVHRAIREASVRQCERIDSACTDAAIDYVRKDYEVTLNSRRVEELLHVRAHGEPSGKDDISNQLLLNGYILPYSNGHVWFAPHPILRGVRAEL